MWRARISGGEGPERGRQRDGTGWDWTAEWPVDRSHITTPPPLVTVAAARRSPAASPPASVDVLCVLLVLCCCGCSCSLTAAPSCVLSQERRTEPAPLVFRSARPHVPVLPSPLPSLSAGLPAVEVGGSKGVEVKAAEFKLDRSADPVATAYTPTSALTASYGSRGSESEEDARSDSRRPKRTRDSAKNEK